MKGKLTFLVVALSMVAPILYGQTIGKSPYPIIFVHGFDSRHETWDQTIARLETVFGDYDPVIDVFHVVLNQYSFTTDVLVDVGVDFPNHTNNPSADGSLFAINFNTSLDANGNLRKDDPNHIDSGQSEGNQSAIVKQGYALSQMICKVLENAEASKVILIGHSMGGLAIREYLQRIENGNHRWWDDNIGHRVAKVITIGTPHVGTNLLKPFGQSEAVRDLRWEYPTIDPNVLFPGLYFFGGDENILTQVTGTFDNFDVDCDGNENSTVVGINTLGTFTFNPGLSLPVDIEYTWITSDIIGTSGDGVVALQRQWLHEGVNPTPSTADTLLTDRVHFRIPGTTDTGETTDYRTIARALDEPDVQARAYGVGFDILYSGLITEQPALGITDEDYYQFEIEQPGVNVTVTVNENNGSGIIEARVFAPDGTETNVTFTNELTQSITIPNASDGTYYLRIKGLSTLATFLTPYTFMFKIGVDVWQPINTGLTNLNIRSIVIDPGNTSTIYTGTSGGVFKSLDGGDSWNPSSTGFIDLNIQDLVIDPQNSSTLYAGTVGGGVHKSTDAANTWNPINTGLPTLFVPAVAVHLQNSSIVYCGPDAFGIYRSINGGNTWSRVGAFRDTRSFALDPVNPAIAYAATVFSIRKTTNDGASWFFSGSGLPSPFMNGLAIDPLNTSTVYSGPHQNGVWKTTNGGSSWFASNNGMLSGVTVRALAVNPTSPNIIYAGTDVAGVFKSTDVGNNWVSFNDGLTNLIVKPNALVIDPSNPDIVYVGTGGGIFKLEPVDITPPSTSITSVFDGYGDAVANCGVTVSTSITFTFEGTDNVGIAGFECSLDAAAFSSCTSPQSFSGLVVGSHVFQAKAIDASSNTDPTPASFTWTILTPQQATKSLTVEVKVVITRGVLNQGQGNALTAILNAALQQLNQGNTTAAINQLQAFVNQVNALISSGVLAQAEGLSLIDEVNNIINELNGSSKLAVTRQTEASSLPRDYALEQNYPNPFNPETEIRFQLPKTSHVMLRIFNTLGQEIRTLVDKQYEAGHHNLRWDSKDKNGNTVSSGVYFYQLLASNFSETKKMLLIR